MRELYVARKAPSADADGALYFEGEIQTNWRLLYRLLSGYVIK